MPTKGTPTEISAGSHLVNDFWSILGSLFCIQKFEHMVRLEKGLTLFVTTLHSKILVEIKNPKTGQKSSIRGSPMEISDKAMDYTDNYQLVKNFDLRPSD